MSRAALAATIAVLALLMPAPALALGESRAELLALAERASAGERAALLDLRAVDEVDGEPVDLDVALAGAEGAELEARLEELSRSASTAPYLGPGDPNLARERALDILEEQAGEAPPADPGGSDEPLLDLGVPMPLALAFGFAAVLAGALIARSAARRSIREGRQPETKLGESPAVAGGPRELERAAHDAERRGDFREAVRLRFQAGLVRLDARGSIRLQPSLTASAAARELRSRRLAELARSYEEIVFGGRAAGSADAERARGGWRAVLAEVP